MGKPPRPCSEGGEACERLERHLMDVTRLARERADLISALAVMGARVNELEKQKGQNNETRI